jgi:hypothetical protein
MQPSIQARCLARWKQATLQIATACAVWCGKYTWVEYVGGMAHIRVHQGLSHAAEDRCCIQSTLWTLLQEARPAQACVRTARAHYSQQSQYSQQSENCATTLRALRSRSQHAPCSSQVDSSMRVRTADNAASWWHPSGLRCIATTCAGRTGCAGSLPRTGDHPLSASNRQEPH